HVHSYPLERHSDERRELLVCVAPGQLDLAKLSRDVNATVRVVLVEIVQREAGDEGLHVVDVVGPDLTRQLLETDHAGCSPASHAVNETKTFLRSLHVHWIEETEHANGLDELEEPLALFVDCPIAVVLRNVGHSHHQALARWTPFGFPLYRWLH